MSILRGLALSGPWSGYLAPTCTSRSQEGYQAHGHGGSVLFFALKRRAAASAALASRLRAGVPV